MATVKLSISERRQKAVFDWACNQRASRLASLLVNAVSSKTIKEIFENENLKLK
jgi:hypothetical protein